MSDRWAGEHHHDTDGARSAPLALLFDDVHWADNCSLKLLQHLAHTTRNAPVLLAVSFRDVQIGEKHPELAQPLKTLSRERLAERITVRRLSLEETTTLVAGTLGGPDVSEEFASFVYRCTQGNSRLVDQWVCSLGGRLELQGEIGAGSTGRVFRAFDQIAKAIAQEIREPLEPEGYGEGPVPEDTQPTVSAVPPRREPFQPRRRANGSSHGSCRSRLPSSI